MLPDRNDTAGNTETNTFTRLLGSFLRLLPFIHFSPEMDLVFMFALLILSFDSSVLCGSVPS